MRFNRCDSEQAMKFCAIGDRAAAPFRQFPSRPRAHDRLPRHHRSAGLHRTRDRQVSQAAPCPPNDARHCRRSQQGEGVAALIARKEREMICRLREGCRCPHSGACGAWTAKLARLRHRYRFPVRAHIGLSGRRLEEHPDRGAKISARDRDKDMQCALRLRGEAVVPIFIDRGAPIIRCSMAAQTPWISALPSSDHVVASARLAGGLHCALPSYLRSPAAFRRAVAARKELLKMASDPDPIDKHVG